MKKQDPFVYKLLTGEFIIANIYPTEEAEGIITLQDPAELIIKRNTHGPLGFLLYPWAPNELLGSTLVAVKNTLICAMMQPSPALLKFYEQWTAEENDKMKSFRELFEKQINKIGEDYVKRTKMNRESQQKTQSIADSDLSEALIDLFDDKENGWGDPSISH